MLLAAGPVLAADIVVVVTPTDLGTGDGQWHPANEQDGGVSQITATQPDPQGGTGSLEQSLPAPDSNSPKTDFQLLHQTGFGLLNELDALGFDWVRDSSSTAPGHLTPALRLYVYDPDADDSYLLIWEGVYNGYPSGGDVPTDTWISQDVLAGNFWRVPQFIDGNFLGIDGCADGVTDPADPSACFVFDRGLGDWSLGPNTIVAGLEVGLGSGWEGSYLSFVDYVRLGFNGDTTIYDFEPAADDTEDTTGPVSSGLAVMTAYVGMDATVTATVDDSTTGGSTIASAEFTLDSGATWTPLDADDGAFDAVAEAVTGTIPGASLTTPGPLEVCVRGTDSAGNVGESACVTVEVVDAATGFVTGGGWIFDPNAPEETKNPKVTFGFNAMYAPGGTELHGSVQVNVHTTKLNFHANTIELLIVDPATGMTQIEGWGRVKYPGGPDQIDAGFRMWIVDGEPDQMHLQIFTVEDDSEEGDTPEETGETVVYDTGGLINLEGGEITLHSDPPTQEDVEMIEERVEALIAQAELDAGIEDTSPETGPNVLFVPVVAQS